MGYGKGHRYLDSSEPRPETGKGERCKYSAAAFSSLSPPAAVPRQRRAPALDFTALLALQPFLSSTASHLV